MLKVEPDLTEAPPKVRRLLAKCLEKDPRRRLHDIYDAWDLLEDQAVAPVSGPPRRLNGSDAGGPLALSSDSSSLRSSPGRLLRHVTRPPPPKRGGFDRDAPICEIA